MDNKLIAKKKTRVVYNSLLMVVIIMTMIRWISAFNSDIVVINAEINFHISNYH